MNNLTQKVSAKIYRWLAAFALVAFCGFNSNGQIAVTVTGNTNTVPALAASYTSLADAITGLNTVTSMTGAVTFNLAAGGTESVTAQQTITTAGNLSFAITFQKSGAGANPILTRTDAGANTTSAVGALGDGIIRIDGTDNIHFNGLDLAASNQGIEYGYYTHKPSATNACQTLSIKNCAITMTKGTSGFVAGIHIGNGSVSVSSATGVTVSANSGRTENVTITGCTIENVHCPIVARGSSATGFQDINLVVGQSGAGNTLRNFGGGSATSTYGVYMIYQYNTNISYNTINNTAGGGSAHTSTLYGVFWSSGCAGTAIVANNNNITLTQTGTSGVQWLYNSSNSPTSITMNNNTFAGSIGSTTTSYILYNNNSSATVTANGNVTSGTITKTGASGTFYGYYNNGSPSSGTETISANNFSNISVTGTSIFLGINSTTGVGQNCDIYNNTVSSVSGGSGTLTGIYVTYHATRNIYGNTISGISGSGSIIGIGNSTTTNATVNNVYNNRICDLSSSSSATTAGLVTGILVASNSGATTNVYNNLIGNLTASAATGTDAIRGIGITSTTASTNINVSYNTIYLNATGAGNFGTSGVYHTTSTTATTANLTLRNNIIYNNSTPSGTGVTAAYRRSSTTNTNYNAASNRNLFWGGAPNPTNQLIFTNGTNSYDQLANYQAYIVTQDQNSVTEDVQWESTACASADFLKYDDATASAAESGAANIAGITTDVNNTIRQGNGGYTGTGSAPDIGAWELEGALPGCGTPALANTLTTNATPCNAENFTLSLDIAYGLGYTYQWQEATVGAGGPYTNIGGATNVTLITSSGVTKWYRCIVTCTSSTISTPSTEVQVTIATPLNGAYTIDNTGGGDYLTFAAAISDLSCLGVSGPVTFNVVAGQTFVETSSLLCTFTGTSSNTITFQRIGAGANPKIQRIGTSGTTDHILALNGVDYYTFNGIDFEQTGTSASDWVEYGIAIVNASATNGSQNNTFKNGTITLSNANASARGVFINQAVTATNATGTNSTNKFLNMTVTNSYVGYYVTGSSTTLDDGNEIDIELLGLSLISNLGDGIVTGSMYGVYSTHQTNFKVKNTEFTNFNQGGTSLMYGVTCQTSASNSADISNNHMHGFTGAGTMYGIYFSSMSTGSVHDNHIHDFVCNTTTSSSVRGIYMSATGANVNIYNNRIYDITSNGLTTTTAAGIDVGIGLVYNIYNNMVSDISAPSSTTTTGGTRGISVSSGSTGGVVRIYYNSIYLTDVGAVAGYTSAGIHNASVTPTLDIRNNIVSNESDISGFGTRVVAFWKTAATDNVDNASNNNLYYAGVPNATHLIYYDGTNSAQTISAYNSLAAITPGESASQTEDVTWQAIVNGILRPDAVVPTVIESGAAPIAGYTADFEADLRNLSTPDMGADEGTFTVYVPPVPDCATYDAPANAATDVCSYGTVTLDWTAAITGGPVTLGYDVYFGTNPTPPFLINVSTTNYSPAGILPNTTYYWKIVPKNASGDAVGCATYSFTTINAVVTTANGDTRCGPGTVNLTATGGGTFNWYTAASGGSPVATGSPYSPSVSGTTNYWVSASDGGINGNVGPLNNTLGTGAGSTILIGTQQLFFDVLAPSMTINTVTVYPTATIGSSFTIVIQNSSAVQVYSSGPILTTVTGGATPQVVTLNATLPSGTGYRFGFSTNPGMWRNDAGYSYPYTLPGVVSITGNSFNPIYYYFFYNWSVSTGCESPRTMVTATVNPLPTVSLVSSTNASCFGVPDGAIDVTVGAGTAPYTTSTMGASFSAIVVPKNPSHPYYGTGSANGFELDGVQGKELTLVRGVTYTFNINSPGHPMYISTDADGAGVGEVLSGVTGSQTDFGTLTFTPNAGHANLLYYQCFNHLNMGWKINIVDPPLNYDLASLHAGNYDITVTDANSCTATLATVTITEPAPNTFYYDGDSDTYGDENETAIGCTAPAGYVTNDDDCDDNNLAINPGASEICGNAIDENCDGLAETVAPAQPSVISGAPADVCPPATGINLSVTNDPNATSYTWYTGPGTTGVTFNPVSTTNSQTIDIGASANSTYGIRVTASNACGTSAYRSISIRRATSTPAAVSGPTTVCALGTYGYSTGAVTGATSYVWSGPAGTLFDGSNPTPYTTASNSVTATLPAGFTTGTIGVAAQVACFTSTVKTLAISSTPAVIGIMTGATVVCPNTAYIYSVPLNAAVATYNWTLPVGASGSSTTNSITVTYGATVASSNICVTGTSLCGSTTAARCITTGPGIPARPASITGPSNGLCNQTVSYTCPVVAGASSYTWSSSAGGTINSGQGTNGINITFPTFTNTPAKTVCVVSNNACGTSVPRCITINGAPNTAAGITANPTSWCANATGIVFTANLTGVTGSYTLNWTYPGASVATYVSGGGNNTTLTLDWLTGSGNVAVTTSNACGNGTRTVAFASTCREGEETIAPLSDALHVYPNPTTGNINIEFSTLAKGNATVTVTDVAGRTVISQNITTVEGANNTQLDLSTVAKGVYMLSVNTAQGNNKIKIVVE